MLSTLHPHGYDEPLPGPPTPPSRLPPLPPAGMPTKPFIDGRGATLAYREYQDEDIDLPWITYLCEQELSEPYNVYTFRYFLSEWPHLTLFVFPSAEDPTPIGVIICKQDIHRERTNRGYIGMLSVDRQWRRRGIARKLVELAVKRMQEDGVQEIVLETEYDNGPSLALYERLGFVRQKLLHRFYSNGKDAFRLIRPLSNYPLCQESGMDQAHAHFLSLSGPAKDEAYGYVPPELQAVFSGPKEPKPKDPNARLSPEWPSVLGAEALDVSRLSLQNRSIRPPPQRRDVPGYII